MPFVTWLSLFFFVRPSWVPSKAQFVHLWEDGCSSPTVDRPGHVKLTHKWLKLFYQTLARAHRREQALLTWMALEEKVCLWSTEDISNTTVLLWLACTTVQSVRISTWKRGFHYVWINDQEALDTSFFLIQKEQAASSLSCFSLHAENVDSLGYLGQ